MDEELVRGALWLADGVVFQNRTDLIGDLGLTTGRFGGCIVLDVLRIHDNLNGVGVVQFLQLQWSELCLSRATAAEDVNFAGGILCQASVDVVGDFGDVQLIGSLGENAGDVEAHVADTDHGHGLSGEFPIAGELRVGVVETYELTRAVVLRQVSARNIQIAVAGRASGEDDGVVELAQFIDADLLTDVHVAQKSDLRLVQHSVEGLNDALDSRVVWRNAVADEAERHWKALVEVDGDVAAGLHQRVGGVDAGRARADHGYTQWCGGVGEIGQ